MRVPFSTVMPPFASPVVRLSRVARGRVTILVAFVMAIALAMGGFAAATVPSVMASTAHAGGQCDHAAATFQTKHAHGSGDCCKVTCACGFAHAIGFVPPSLALAPMRTALPLIREASAVAESATPQLRPPIA